MAERMPPPEFIDEVIGRVTRRQPVSPRGVPLECRDCKRRTARAGSSLCEICDLATQEDARLEKEAQKRRRREDRRKWRAENPELSRRQVYKQSIRRRFGISIEEYENMLEAQDWRCAAFGCDLRELETRAVHLDHCHVTGEVRGILCRSCNQALGHAGDDPERLEALARYVRDHTSTTSPSLT